MTSSKCEKIFQISIKYSKSRTRCIKSDLVRHVFTFFSSGYLHPSTTHFVSIDREKSSLSSSIESAIPSEAILRKIFEFAREGLNNAKKYRAAERVLCAVRVVERKGKREGRSEREREKEKKQQRTTYATTTTTTNVLIHSIDIALPDARTNTQRIHDTTFSLDSIFIYLSISTFISQNKPTT